METNGYSQKRGQVSMLTAIIAGVATVVTSFGGTYFTSSKQIAVIDVREETHFIEITKRLDRIENKLDGALHKNQTNLPIIRN